MKDSSRSTSISLIVATVSRVSELDRMLSSLADQTFKDFEVIIVDQNCDDRLSSTVYKWKTSLTCIHIHSALGASKARNIGINVANGEVLGFPDDDCWYPANLLEQVKTWFDMHKHCGFLCCEIHDENNNEIASRWPGHSIEITRTSVLRACACSSLFIRQNSLLNTGVFDETMGPGPKTLVKSAEEIDLAIRLMKNSHRGWFEKRIYLFHPRREAGTATSDRAYVYGVGFGFLLRKHRYPVFMLTYQVIRPIGGFLRAIARMSFKEMAFYWKSVQGRIVGYFF
jgi:glycosyltransferase involved in cell wall biosynthesis